MSQQRTVDTDDDSSDNERKSLKPPKRHDASTSKKQNNRKIQSHITEATIVDHQHQQNIRNVPSTSTSSSSSSSSLEYLARQASVGQECDEKQGLMRKDYTQRATREPVMSSWLCDNRSMNSLDDPSTDSSSASTLVHSNISVRLQIMTAGSDDSYSTAEEFQLTQSASTSQSAFSSANSSYHKSTPSLPQQMLSLHRSNSTQSLDSGTERLLSLPRRPEDDGVADSLSLTQRNGADQPLVPRRPKEHPSQQTRREQTFSPLLVQPLSRVHSKRPDEDDGQEKFAERTDQGARIWSNHEMPTLLPSRQYRETMEGTPPSRDTPNSGVDSGRRGSRRTLRSYQKTGYFTSMRELTTAQKKPFPTVVEEEEDDEDGEDNGLSTQHLMMQESKLPFF